MTAAAQAIVTAAVVTLTALVGWLMSGESARESRAAQQAKAANEFQK